MAAYKRAKYNKEKKAVEWDAYRDRQALKQQLGPEKAAAAATRAQTEPPVIATPPELDRAGIRVDDEYLGLPQLPRFDATGRPMEWTKEERQRANGYRGGVRLLRD